VMTTVAVGSKLIDVIREKSSLQDLYTPPAGTHRSICSRTMGGGVNDLGGSGENIDREKFWLQDLYPQGCGSTPVLAVGDDLPEPPGHLIDRDHTSGRKWHAERRVFSVCAGPADATARPAG
jgi:hypothetical protein